MNKDYTKLKLFYIILILLLGSFIRIYSINYNDFWSDEMVSFWVSDPSIPLNETIERIFSSQFMVLNEILLKYFHLIFGYDVNVSRYFPFFISVLSLLAFATLLLKITNVNAAIFGLFVISINIYHISYSIELRAYILTFFLVNIFIYFAFINSNLKKNFKYSNTLVLCVISLLLLFNHTINIIVIGSYIFFILTKFFVIKKIQKNEIIEVLSLLIIILIFLLVYFKTTMRFHDPGVFKGISPEWLWQVKPSFFTNYYFSKFFGSRILGMIYLLVLLFCVVKFKGDIIKKFNIYIFFIFLIFFSYFIPLVFGYIFSPILIDRYIFYILIPIICILSHFIFQIKNKKLKIFIIIIITLPTFLNNLLYESSFKQLYTNVHVQKPEIKKALKIIDQSNIKNFTFARDDRYAINTNLIIENYLLKSAEKKKLNLIYESFNKNTKSSKIWVLYLKDTRGFNFEMPKRFSRYVEVRKHELNRVSIHLLQILK